MTHVLLVPGFTGSGPDHWQSHWQRAHPEYSRVEQRDWAHPELEEWILALDAAITTLEGNVVLVGHSLGCITIAHWTARHGAGRVTGALLVAPADVDAPTAPLAIRGFAPIPLVALPYASRVVASTDDPVVSIQRAREFAAAWGSEFASIGAAGHIATASGYGPWPEGQRLLEGLGTAQGSLPEPP